MPPNFPGLINSIKTKAHIGAAGGHLFDIAYLLGVSGYERPFFSQVSQVREPQNSIFVQFSLASTVYFTLSKLFPAHETMLEHAILDEEETPSEHTNNSGIDDEKKDRGLTEVSHIDTGKSLRSV